MIKRSVESPAGDIIELVPDADWVKLTGVSEKAIGMWNGGSKRFVIAELWMGGECSDPKTGRATGLLWERMARRFPGQKLGKPTAFPGLSSDPLNFPAFERVTNGKRTYSIKLIALPESWYAKMRDLLVEFTPVPEPVKPAPAPEPVPAVIDEPARESDAETDEAFDQLIRDMQLDAPTEYATEPPLEIAIASQVAMSLLTTVVEIISAGSSAAVDERVRKLTGDITDIQSKLGQRLEENDRMRRQLRQAGDEITALRHERDGLRSRLRATEANLTAALKGDAVQAINGEIQRRVESIMRVAPKTKGDD